MEEDRLKSINQDPYEADDLPPAGGCLAILIVIVGFIALTMWVGVKLYG